MPNALTIRGPIGDMLKSVYDINKDGKVDVVESQISDLDHDALKIAGVEIDDTAKADGYLLTYDQATDKIIYGPGCPESLISSIQHVSITIPDFTDHASASISTVDMDKAFLIYAGSYVGSPFEEDCLFLIELIDTTHVRATRYGSNAESYVNCHVVEFTSGIASIQRGLIDLTNLNQKDATINSVDTDKTFVNLLGTITTQTDPRSYCTRLTLLNSTTVRAYRTDNSGVAKVSFEALEFS